MSDSDSDYFERSEVLGPYTAVLERPRVANYIADVSYEVNTADHEDHTFFGIMFDLEAKGDLPIEHLILNEVWVRGDLGHVTVWYTEGSFDHVKTKQEAWHQASSAEDLTVSDYNE